jgi:hypothetical protein
MRRVLLGAGLFAGCALAAAGAGSSAAAHCGPFDAKTLAASGSVRVYVLGKTVYGCSMRGSGAVRLGTRSSCVGGARVDPVVAAGEFAAYGLSRCGVDTGYTQVIVRRLTDGKVVRSAAATSPPGVESYQSVGSLVLRRDGAVAWIGNGQSIIGHGHVIEVHKARRRGPVALLDSGLAVRPGSLRLRGSQLTWRHGTALLHARLS